VSFNFHWCVWRCFDTNPDGRVLKRKGNENIASEHEEALALLDLDGMDED